ncbi:MAG: hypothetical protein QME28_02505 [Candidatus Saccharicenans sp.]|nr:hypothetical protein [Candidatus Saccharicenans sp.]
MAALSSRTGKNEPELAEKIVQTASRLISSGNADHLDPALVREYLVETSRSSFLQNLSYPGGCWLWADTCFYFIQQSGYSLLDLFVDRVREDPERILFVDLSDRQATRWTYSEIAGYLKLLARSFYLFS